MDGALKHFLFSYGSNSTLQLQARTGANNLVAQPAFLDNHIRIFSGYSSIRKGGVASVHPLPGHSVFGAVCQLTDSELSVLDSFEGTRSGAYRREVIAVHVRTPTGSYQPTDCFVYFKYDPLWATPPSLSYMNAMRIMLDEVNRGGPKRKILIRGIVHTGGKNAVNRFGYFKDGHIVLYRKPLPLLPPSDDDLSAMENEA